MYTAGTGIVNIAYRAVYREFSLFARSARFCFAKVQRKHPAPLWYNVHGRDRDSEYSL